MAVMPCSLAIGGFTLVELLIVVGIILMVAGMMAGSFSRQTDDADVAKAAQQLVWDLRRARTFAVQQGGVFGIAINMEARAGQAPSNQSGTHWYRMFGPSPKLLGGLAQNSIPIADYLNDDLSASKPNPFRARTLGEVTAAISRIWQGEPVHLPRNKVRFLALSDMDDGTLSVRTPTKAPVYPLNYPRPWFGFYDAGHWHPWGQGYNIEADTFDYIVCFLPNGGAIVPEFRRNKRYYGSDEVKKFKDRPPPHEHDSPYKVNDAFDKEDYRKYLPFQEEEEEEEEKKKEPAAKQLRAFTQPEGHLRPAWECWWDMPEITHFVRHTGGWHITLAKDDDGGTAFASAEEVLQSILPAYRIHVGVNGTITSFKVRGGRSVLQGWSKLLKWGTSSTDAINPSSRYRTGYLTPDAPRQGGAPITPPWPLQPVGMPITDRVDVDMLTQRIWWVDRP